MENPVTQNIDESTSTKDREKKEQKGQSLPVIMNQYPERNMILQLRPSPETYSEAVRQKKKWQ